MLEVTLPIAFVFGLISFISPCVLPLVPAYISYLGGRALQNAEVTAVQAGPGGTAVATRSFGERFALGLHGLAFVFGFTIVFVLLGVITTALIREIGGQNVSSVTGIIGRLGGLLIVFFGLHFGGFLPALFDRARRAEASSTHALIVAGVLIAGVIALVWGVAGRLTVWEPAYTGAPVWPDALALLSAAVFGLALFASGAFANPRQFIVNTTTRIEMGLYQDTRGQMDQDGRGLLSSMLMGIVFSAGWSPCIGTVYGSILTLSAQTGNVGLASLQLTAYSLGLGIPFILSALALDRAQGIMRRLNRRMKTIKRISGIFLVLIGVLVASGELQRLTLQLSSGELADLSLQLEERALEIFVPDAGGK
ncbi:MAG: hypothetical protein IT298_08560 [Chloroflexi bacterium]|nr:MAG: cytochrome c-type biogenesis protein CcdA [Chloroflexi bacterium OLB13]MBC6956393.1 hypothetical protein [Chloroflexota bacterium]MBV6436390.1 hypothetical protein [Anaerolineae bacterium]MDL1916552.1 hypothetical protein [Anaerolineae bacterium CFX4]MBW7879913.1 hypothetical protein [Anaerolineae bacterium]